MQKVTTPFLSIVLLLLLSPLFSFCQQPDVDADELLKKNHEVPDDPYLPNEFNNKNTTPAYQYSKSGITEVYGSTVLTRQVNVDPAGKNISGDAANEPSIAVNPLDANKIVIGWRQFDNVSSNFRQAGWGYSVDGGNNWNFPGKIDPGVFHSDPVLDFDAEGNFYYNSLLQSFNTRVYKSMNGGAMWDNGVPAGGGDKQWMAIDRTSGVGKGNIYSSWTDQYTTCPPGFFTRSANAGVSFGNCTQVTGHPYFGTEAVGNSGDLYIAGANNTNNNIVVSKSVNAKNAGSTVTWNTPVYVYMDGAVGGTNANPAGLLGQVNVDVDRSGGSAGGEIVYLLASLDRMSNSDVADVMFVKSLDGGLTWGAPKRVNDDLTNSKIQWLAVMSVAPNGRIDAAWLDTRDAPAGSDSSALYYSYSLDKGDTWSVNEKLSPLFNPHIGYPNQNKMGDYFDMVSDNTGAHLAWTGTFTGGQDVYYSRIIPPVVTTASSEINKHNFYIAPNPTNGIFTLKGELSSVKAVVIYNIIGEQIQKRGEMASIDLSSQPAGVYFLKVIGMDGSVVVKKIIKD